MTEKFAIKIHKGAVRVSTVVLAEKKDTIFVTVDTATKDPEVGMVFKRAGGVDITLQATEKSLRTDRELHGDTIISIEGAENYQLFAAGTHRYTINIVLVKNVDEIFGDDAYIVDADES